MKKYLFLCFQNLSRNLRVLESGPEGPLVSGGGRQRELKKLELWGHQFQPENIQFHLFFLLFITFSSLRVQSDETVFLSVHFPLMFTFYLIEQKDLIPRKH